MNLHYSSRKYRQLVEWIALNDDAVERDETTISESLTVTMLAHCFNVKNELVALDVLQFRGHEH